MATIKDVARLAGVSPSTASRAMHGNPVISEKTRRRVVKAMEELNYAPDFNAQNLAKKESNTVGVVLPVDHHEIFSNPFFLEIIRGINEECYQQGIMVTLATGVSRKELAHNINVMVSQGNIHRFILLYSEKDDPILQLLVHLKTQYVIVGKPYSNVNETRYVDNDNILAGTDATDYLLKHKHQKIAYIYSDSTKMVQNDRLLGYQRAMMEHQLPTILLAEAFTDHSDSKAHIRQFFKEYNDVTAAVVSDDMLALKLQQLLISDETIIDHPLSLIAFNNSIFSEVAHPTLTSIAVFPKRLGVEAAKITLSETSDDDLATKVIVPHQIVVRHSVFTNK